MRHAPLIFCALILLTPALCATPGDDFMARDEVLKNGAMPMSVLEIHLKEWVAKAKKA